MTIRGRSWNHNTRFLWVLGENDKVVKHKDNLKLEGSFEGRRKSMTATKGERSEVKKHQDNLFMEGEFQGRF